jgi:hypothetical protein
MLGKVAAAAVMSPETSSHGTPAVYLLAGTSKTASFVTVTHLCSRLNLS